MFMSMCKYAKAVEREEGTFDYVCVTYYTIFFQITFYIDVKWTLDEGPLLVSVRNRVN